MTENDVEESNEIRIFTFIKNSKPKSSDRISYATGSSLFMRWAIFSICGHYCLQNYKHNLQIKELLEVQIYKSKKKNF